MIAELMWLEVFNNNRSFGLPLKLYTKKEKIKPDQKVSQRQWKKKIYLFHYDIYESDLSDIPVGKYGLY